MRSFNATGRAQTTCNVAPDVLKQARPGPARPGTLSQLSGSDLLSRQSAVYSLCVVSLLASRQEGG